MRSSVDCMLAVLLFSVPATAAAAEAPYPPSPVIADMLLDWSTHQRHAQGSDNFQLTWADGGHQYGWWGDGGGGRNNDSMNTIRGIFELRQHNR